MVMTDPIADMLTRIRNANAALHETVEIPSSKMKAAVLEILKEEGFVKSVETVENGKHTNLKVTLKYGSTLFTRGSSAAPLASEIVPVTWPSGFIITSVLSEAEVIKIVAVIDES